jgi:hypothetical protein
MSPDDFDRLQSLMASRAGFRLTRDRMKLAEHRLGPLARREGYETVDALLASLWARPVAALGWAVIEALLNPETWFRRDRKTFDTFAGELLPALSAARDGAPVKVWSAGCSTGQEAWSLAMAASDAGFPVEIVAPDHALRDLDDPAQPERDRRRGQTRQAAEQHAEAPQDEAEGDEMGALVPDAARRLQALRGADHQRGRYNENGDRQQAEQSRHQAPCPWEARSIPAGAAGTQSPAPIGERFPAEIVSRRPDRLAVNPPDDARAAPG